MKRREFLKSMTALAAGSVMPAAPAVWSPAKAQSRAETLLIVSESGPNNIDIHGVGTNVPGYEVSWNCYDRLISHEMKTVNGTPYYDRDKFKMELADDMNDRRHVRHLQAEEECDLPRRHAGHRQGRQMVARPRGHRRRLSDLPDGRGLAHQSRAVRGRRRQHRARRLPAQGSPDNSRSRRHRARDLQFRAGEEARQREGSLGSRIYQAEHRRQRRLSRRELERRHRGDPRAQRQVDGRPAAEGQAGGLADGAVRRQPPRAARARRCRHLLRPAEQGLR